MKRWLRKVSDTAAYGSFTLLLAALVLGWIFYHFAPWPPS